ncbi:HD domain-containing protein [Flavobacterium psychrotrophum]|uniref:HD domain-containing protein n=1 Tax=Flavobacterium psychrotrophum TaxID=2294119 RepID=UPI000E312BAB|nr:hypothetical protein [Flavobacterium psychrotrophum]
MHLKENFLQLVTQYANAATAGNFWMEVEKHYTAKGRHYHTLVHLDNLYAQLLAFKHHIDNWDTIVFSIAYHDVIYSATARDNEEKSAELAVKRLEQINFSTVQIALCNEQIRATKHHQPAVDNDTNLFTDADLSILGAPWPEYEQYYKSVRKEYCIYPDFLYKPGRKKAMLHFLEMDFIFKTDAFRHQFEATARENINREIEILTID